MPNKTGKLSLTTAFVSFSCKDGNIAWKHVGPFDPANVETTLMPEIEKALAAQ